jgi:AbrB family looped-hinge helix DNA binding protein
MPIVKVLEKGQATLPAKIRQDIGLETGDYVMVEKEGSRIVLTPQAVVERDPKIDAALEKALADVRAGRTVPFTSKAEFDAWLETEEGKQFTKPE